MRRTCPLCALRDAAVVTPDCGVCHGHGYLTLGHATRTYEPAAVSTAIHLVLEQTARALDLTTRRGTDPAPALAAALARAAKAGLVTLHTTTVPADEEPGGSNAPPAAHLAHQALGVEPTATDQAMIRAHPYPYTHSARPGARGLPLLSSNFHPSSLARVGDPQDFETTTAKQLVSRDKNRYQARSLAFAAITDPPKKRTRR